MQSAHQMTQPRTMIAISRFSAEVHARGGVCLISHQPATDSTAAITEMRWGAGGVGDVGSGFREIIIVDDASDPIDTVIKDYVAYDAGITLA